MFSYVSAEARVPLTWGNRGWGLPYTRSVTTTPNPSLNSVIATYTYSAGGPGTYVPPAGAQNSLSGSGLTAFTLVDGDLDNTVTWNPTLVVDVPYTAPEGEYTTTVYHSVA